MTYSFEALMEAFRQLPEDSAERAACIINAHPRIFVYGAGRSGLMLKALAMRLAQAGRMVYVVGETITPAIGENDLLILASASGNTASVCRYARIAKNAGADILILTASPESELTGIAGKTNFCFRTPTKEDGVNPVSLMGTLFEQAVLLFCDQIILCLNENAAEMRKRHTNLE